MPPVKEPWDIEYGLSGKRLRRSVVESGAVDMFPFMRRPPSHQRKVRITIVGDDSGSMESKIRIEGKIIESYEVHRMLAFLLAERFHVTYLVHSDAYKYGEQPNVGRVVNSIAVLEGNEVNMAPKLWRQGVSEGRIPVDDLLDTDPDIILYVTDFEWDGYFYKETGRFINEAQRMRIPVGGVVTNDKNPDFVNRMTAHYNPYHPQRGFVGDVVNMIQVLLRNVVVD